MARHAWWAAVLGLVAGVGLAACAARGAAPTNTAAMDVRKDDIRELWIQIRDWRVALGMTADPVPAGKIFMAKAVTQLRACPVPEQEPSGTCGDTCNLKEAICDNAESICRIADELEGDAWAADKCKSAKSSCKEATDRCCACTGEADAD